MTDALNPATVGGEMAHVFNKREPGPVVRTDSLVEQRRFEPPVLFVVPGA